MDHKTTIVLLTFLVAITPSLSDMVQINAYQEGSWKWVLLWYFILIILLTGLWEHL